MTNAEIIVALGVISLSLTLSISTFVIARTTLVKSLVILWMIHLVALGLTLESATEFSMWYITNGAMSFIMWVGNKERTYDK